MRLNRWHLVAALTLLCGALWLWVNRAPVGAEALHAAPEPAVGHPAPDFTLTTLDRREFTLSDLRGTPVVLNFWATWCGPCKRELPELQQAARQYEGRVEIVAVDQGEAATIVQQMVDEMGMTFAVPMDFEFSVGDRYNVRGLPTTFFIDRTGVIRDMWAGEMNKITLAEKIRLIYP